MADTGIRRQLKAIFSADVKGYSRLMGDDDESTVKAITACRKIISDLINKHQGRVVDTPGDNILAVFGSTLNAVNSAVEIQHRLETENGKLPDSRRMDFRIGINLGDIIHKDDRIYGDGVNVAARIESLADPGGVCISRGVFDQVKNRVRQGFEYLGEHSVKNIAEPVRIYRVLFGQEFEGKIIEEPSGRNTKLKKPYAFAIALLLVCSVALLWIFFPRQERIEPALLEKMAFPLPDKPSIAVLPFDNMSEDKEQDYLSDGFTEAIIATLAQSPELFVIDRNSAFTYRGKPTKVKQVAQDLGVRYVLEGSVQRSDDRVRITAQLVDAINGRHLWGNKYDRHIEDLFAVQDEISRNVFVETHVTLAKGEHERVASRGTQNIDALLLRMKGLEEGNKATKAGILKARELYGAAADVDPKYARAWAGLSWSYSYEAMMGGWTMSRNEALKNAFDYAENAVEVDPQDPSGYIFLGYCMSLRGDYDQAIAYCNKAVELAPNDFQANGHLGTTLMWAEEPELGLEYLERAKRLNPRHSAWVDDLTGFAHLMVEHNEEAVKFLRRGVDRSPNSDFARGRLIAALVAANHLDEAKTEAGKLLKEFPDFTISNFVKTHRFKDPARLEWLSSLLLKAGLPERPSLKLPDKPSIAVLPFTNMSDDPQQEYFSDGITDDLITDLSKISGLLVIARNSTFTYKGKLVNVNKVAADLGVRYVLEGSVRRSGNKVRISAQLIDASTGHNLWAERFDGKIGDIFDLQDSFTKRIVAALSLKLTGDERTNFTLRYTDNVEAYDAYLKGREQFFTITRDGLAKAVGYFEKAIELDSEYSPAHAGLSHAYLKSIEMHYNEELGWPDARSRARKHLQVATKNPTPYVHYVVAKNHLYQRRYDEALAAAESAITLDPNYPDGHLLMGIILTFAGRSAEALDYFNKGMRLDPQYPAIYLYYLGLAQYFLNQYASSLTNIEKSRRLAPHFGPWPLAITYAQLNRGQEAADILARYFEKRGWPVVFIESTFRSWPFKEQKDMDHWAEGMRKSGLMRPWNPVYRREYEKAIADAEQAIIRDANDAKAHYTMGESLVFCGRSAEAIDYLKKAISLDPDYPGYYLYTLGLAQFCLEKYEAAVNSLESCFYKRKMHGNPPMWLLAATYAYLGRQSDAEDVLSKYTKENRFEDYTVERVLKYHLHAFKEPEDTHRFAQGLHIAGLPLN